jgi:hypothetical protein
VGALLAEDMRRKSSKETSALEAMLIRGRTKEQNEKVFLDTSQDTERVNKNVGTMEKHDISRKIVGRERNLRKNLRRKKIWL